MANILLIKRAIYSKPEYIHGNKVVRRFETIKEAIFHGETLFKIDKKTEGNNNYEYVVISKDGKEYAINNLSYHV